MKKSSILIFVFLIIIAFGFQAVSAQITINLPKIPKIKKDKPTAPKPGGSESSESSQSSESNNPGYDKQEFTNITWGNNDYINPYLECYAKKHNLELIKVTDNAFSSRRFDNAKQMKQTLQDELPKLAEIESALKSKLKTRPDTSLSYLENPAIWEEITVNRSQYLQCAVAAKESLRVSESVWLQAHLEEIAKRQKEVDSYTPDRGWFTGEFTYDHLLNAVSLSARAEWLKGANAMEFKENVDPPLDALAASAAKKLPLYLPGAANFTFHNLPEEKMMKGTLRNISTLKIHKIGLRQASWLISKNDLGIPTARYKQGYIWVRDTADDHPYCHLYQVNIIQDYAGGGTYATSSARFIEDSLYGCPAGQ